MLQDFTFPFDLCYRLNEDKGGVAIKQNPRHRSTAQGFPPETLKRGEQQGIFPS